MPGFAEREHTPAATPANATTAAWPTQPFYETGTSDQADPFRSLWSPDALAAPGPTDPSALLPWMDGPAPGSAVADAMSAPTTAADTTRPATAAERRLTDERMWATLAGTPIHEAYAPKTLHIPDTLNQRLGQSFTQSNAENLEHCGVLSAGHAGSFVTHADRTGGIGGCGPDARDSNDRVIADYHTHPMDPKETSPYSTFSDGDINDLADQDNYPWNIAVMRSGADHTVAMVKTAEFEALIDQVESAGPEDIDDAREEFSKSITDTYESACHAHLKKHPHDDAGAQEAGMRAASAKFHFLYYTGVGADLTLVGDAGHHHNANKK